MSNFLLIFKKDSALNNVLVCYVKDMIQYITHECTLRACVGYLSWSYVVYGINNYNNKTKGIKITLTYVDTSLHNVYR